MDGQSGSTTTSRRRFLGTAAGATGVALAATVWSTKQAAAADIRTYTAANFALELENTSVGVLKSVDGGGVTADVINETSGTSYFVKKHIGQPKYEEFELQLGFSMSKAVYDWIAASWSQNYSRKNGAIQAADYKLEVKNTREFFNALITETGFPASDAASKEPAYMTLKFAPEYTRNRKGDGSKIEGASNKQQKLWLPSNFKLEIDGLDCTKVNKVDAFTVKQTVATDDIGDSRDYLKEPGKIDFPNLKVHLAQSGAQSWYDYFEDFVIKGNNGENKEKNGSLTFLDPTRTTPLARIDFFNMGIFSLTEDSAQNGDTIARVTAELYVERMAFIWFAPGTGTNPSPTPTNGP